MGHICRPCWNTNNRRIQGRCRQRQREGTTLPFGEPCGCCHEPMTNPHGDHDHATGVDREWLCSRCNRTIGLHGHDDPAICIHFAIRNELLADNPRTKRGNFFRRKADWWRKAALYLMRHRR